MAVGEQHRWVAIAGGEPAVREKLMDAIDALFRNNGRELLWSQSDHAALGWTTGIASPNFQTSLPEARISWVFAGYCHPEVGHTLDARLAETSDSDSALAMNGVFAFARLDPIEDVLTVGSDRHGMGIAYHTELKGCRVVSTDFHLLHRLLPQRRLQGEMPGSTCLCLASSPVRRHRWGVLNAFLRPACGPGGVACWGNTVTGTTVLCTLMRALPPRICSLPTNSCLSSQ